MVTPATTASECVAMRLVFICLRENAQDHGARTIIVASKHARKPGFACIRLLFAIATHYEFRLYQIEMVATRLLDQCGISDAQIESVVRYATPNTTP